MERRSLGVQEFLAWGSHHRRASHPLVHALSVLPPPPVEKDVIKHASQASLRGSGRRRRPGLFQDIPLKRLTPRL